MGKAIKKRLERKQHLDFILAGKAYVTFKNVLTGNRFTYKIISKKNTISGPHFVYVLYGGVEEKRNYTYVGTIFGLTAFRHTKKSKVTQDGKIFKVFKYVFEHLTERTLPDNIEIWHEGRCGRCGKMLTVPESIESGYGPECQRRTKKDKQKKIEYAE